MSEKHTVTGAFGYTGRYIAKELLQLGHQVATLTNSPPRINLFNQPITVHSLAFHDHSYLVNALKDTQVLYNTYWVRFNHKTFNHSEAVTNTKALFLAARNAGVQRIVHTSITNPDKDSPFEYFRGKAVLEEALDKSGAPYTILRPAVFFGEDDILINNITWALRHLPIMGVFGEGNYKIQPIYIKDYVQLAIAAGQESGCQVVDAVGPEAYTYRGMIESIAAIIGCQKKIISVPPWFGYLTGKILGWLTRDQVITREEIGGLMAGLLAVESVPTGTTHLMDWVELNQDSLGVKYANELKRRDNK